MRENTAVLSRDPICAVDQSSGKEQVKTPLGDVDGTMRDTVILSLQPQLRAMAFRFAHQMGLTETSIDRLDLVQEANLVLLEVYTEALCTPNPYAYLMGAARLAMIKSTSSQKRAYTERVFSLDAPLSHESGRTTCLADMIAAPQQEDVSLAQRSQELHRHLQTAIARLTEAQRAVILHHFYGFDGPPESLASISRRFAWSRQNVQQHKQRALAKLRKHLSSSLTGSNKEGNSDTRQGSI